MKITNEMMWQHIGERIWLINDVTDTDGMVLPKGTYQISRVDDSNVTLFDVNKKLNYDLDLMELDGIQFSLLVTSAGYKIEMMIESLTKTILQLVSDGWTIKESKYTNFNLEPFIQDLESLVIVRDVLVKKEKGE